MKTKTVFTLILVLAFNIVLVPVVNADCVELKYDDGTAEIGTSNTEGTQFGVKFTLPAVSVRLVKARFYIWGFIQTFVVHVYDLNGNDLIQPFLFGAYSALPVEIDTHRFDTLTCRLFANGDDQSVQSNIKLSTFDRFRSPSPTGIRFTQPVFDASQSR